MPAAHVAVHHETHGERRRFAGVEHHRTDGGRGRSTPLDNFHVRRFGEAQLLVADVGDVECDLHRLAEADVAEINLLFVRLEAGRTFHFHRNFWRDVAARRLLLRFNGATLFQAWRVEVKLQTSKKQTPLQWGHAFSSVERPPSWDIKTNASGFNGATLFQAWREWDDRGAER